MSSPISKDTVIFHHTPEDDRRAPNGLDTPDLPMAPVVERARSSGSMVSRAYYDAANNKTYTLTVSQGRSKSYLALPESAWRDMLSHLRNMDRSNTTQKMIIDLSTRWVVGVDDDENTGLLVTNQINPQDNREGFDALVSIRQYLVHNKYIEALSQAPTEGYDSRDRVRMAFSGNESSDVANANLRQVVEQMRSRRTQFQNWTTDQHDPAIDTRMQHLFTLLETTRCEQQRSVDQLQQANPTDVQTINQHQQAIAEAKEKLTALAHSKEIVRASALLAKAYPHEGITDWRIPLRMAFDAKQMLLGYLMQQKPQSAPTEQQKIEEYATDIASLLIPPTIGDGENKMSGEAILQLFYGGTQTLSDLVRQPVATEAEIMPAEDRDLPNFNPVPLPQGTGHRYLRELLADFHTQEATPENRPLPPGQEIFARS